MHELRIISGLHRGATLPLDNQALVIGAADDDDVVLVDPGIEAGHARLTRSETGWILEAQSGSIRDANTNRSLSSIELMPGEFARVGKVWITVVALDAGWEDPPPEPEDDPFFDADESVDSAGEPVMADTHAETAMAEHSRDGQPRRYRRGMIYFPLGFAAVLSAAAAYAITSRPEMPSPAVPGVGADVRSEPGASRSAAMKMTGAVAQGVGAEHGLTPSELREAFRKRLADADLLRYFELKLEDNAWNMQAVLDDEEAKRFERILTTFVKTHRITFPVHAKVGGGETMLPFKIRQIVSGANASILTQDGSRLYVGDEYMGVRVVAIQGSRLTFVGKRKIEVTW